MSDNNNPESEPELEAAPAPVEINEEAPGFDVLDEADASNQVATAQNYQVLARKYRPNNFTDLIGQQAMVQTLTHAFESGRIAHAFMLTGVRGVGKTTTARILARALNYQSDTINAPTTMLETEGVHCRQIMDGTHVDVIEMDAASHTGIDDIREIIQNVPYAPAAARNKVYIIDEVHMLSKGAFNGLLKTLEEPPDHVKFIFATTELRKVPVTVLSRCQRFDLRRLTHDDTLQLLTKTCAAEKVFVPEEALSLIARAGDGSARDALSLLDRALAHGEGDEAMNADTMRRLLGLADRGRIFDLFDKLMGGQLTDALVEFDEQYRLGADPIMILADLAELTHWLTRLKFVASAGDDVTFSQEMRVRGKNVAEQLSARHLARVWQFLLNGYDEAQRAMNSRAAAEMVLIRLAHLADSPTPEELIKQWEQAETEKQPETKTETAPPPAANPDASTHKNISADMNAPPPMVAAQSASQADTQAKTQAESQAQSQAEIARAPIVQDFAALIALAAQHRDIALKHTLESAVHLVNFEPAHGSRAGRVEISLAGDGYEALPQELTKKLRQWTGQNWVVSLSQNGGAPTIAQTRQSVQAQRREVALNDPFVKQVLAHFPTAEIVSIRDFNAANDGDEAVPESSSESSIESSIEAPIDPIATEQDD